MGPAFGLTGRAVPGLQGLPAPLQPPTGLGIHSLNDALLLLVPSPTHIQTWLCPRGSQPHLFLQRGWPGKYSLGPGSPSRAAASPHAGWIDPFVISPPGFAVPLPAFPTAQPPALSKSPPPGRLPWPTAPEEPGHVVRSLAPLLQGCYRGPGTRTSTTSICPLTAPSQRRPPEEPLSVGSQEWRLPSGNPILSNGSL